MSHCNPAPPHPDPGTISMAVCWPSLEATAVLVALPIFVSFLVYWQQQDTYQRVHVFVGIAVSSIIAYLMSVIAGVVL